MFTKQQRKRILNDFYYRGIDVPTLVNRYCTAKYAIGTRPRITNELVLLINRNRMRYQKEVIVETPILEPILGSKKDAYFSTEDSYGTIPYYTFEEMTTEVPGYEPTTTNDLLIF